MMQRALSLAKTAGSLLAIEMFVPGGTLIVLTLLLTGRSGSPLIAFLTRRVPALSRLFAR